MFIDEKKKTLSKSSSEEMTISEAMLSWYDKNARPLPWRETGDPYKIWISEIMLQQTTTQTVIPRYGLFLERFPSLEALASSSLESVLGLWQGLGYYQRARQLHKCSKVLVQLGGVFPRTAQELKKLPGIGPYTSAAIASMAFQEPVLALDGNLRRVFCRLFDLDGDPSLEEIQTFGKESIDCDQRPGDLNQGFMDLGATICTPKKPLCHMCPLQLKCLSYKNHTVHLRPAKKKTLEKKKLYTDLFILDTSKGVVLQKCDEKNSLRSSSYRNLLRGLWSLPESPWTSEPFSESRYLNKSCVLIGRFRHIFTHIRLEVWVWKVFLENTSENHCEYCEPSVFLNFIKNLVGRQEVRVSQEGHEDETLDRTLDCVPLKDLLDSSLEKKRQSYPMATLYRKALAIYGDFSRGLRTTQNLL